MSEAAKRMEEIIGKLNKASEAYYNDKEEIMSNYEWDALFDELTKLETETGEVLPESPTGKTGLEESISNGKKEAHEYAALSLAKTKSVADLQKWAGEYPVWVTGKCDGATLVVTYDKGHLTSVLTRGNGYTGTNITFMAEAIQGIPEAISEQGHLVVRGEAIITYSDFQKMNDGVEEEEQYANPRNLVSGTLGLDATRLNVVKERHITLYAFTLVHTDRTILSWGKRMDFLDELGFVTVDRELTNAEELPTVIEKWTKQVEEGKIDIPLDGLVLAYDDTEYAATGSVTGHHATRAGLAFKWKDESADTVLNYVEWSCAVSTISPVAVFEEVQLEGTKVSRASLCNISEMKRLGIGADGKTKLKVIKANKIIPKCIWADAMGTAFTIPKKCPVCGADTEIQISESSKTETLHCMNPHCEAKHIKKYERFVSKSGMDIDGLSRETIIKFLNQGFIRDYGDIYHIEDYKEQIINMEGFGEKSYNNLIQEIEKSRKVSPVRFLNAMCIPMIGVDASKKIIGAVGTQGFFTRLKEETGFEDIEGIGPEKSNSILEWYQEPSNQKILEKLLQEIQIEEIAPAKKTEGTCKNMVFVITGDVHIYKNRDEFKEYVESQGGKVTGSVSKKTDYLVNNDADSPSSKNKKAKELGIPILTEEDFVKLFA